MLTPAAHVPGVLVGEAPVDAGRLLLAPAEPGDRLTLLLSCADPSLAQLDAGAVDALIVALGEARARMATEHHPASDRCA